MARKAFGDDRRGLWARLGVRPSLDRQREPVDAFGVAAEAPQGVEQQPQIPRGIVAFSFEPTSVMSASN